MPYSKLKFQKLTEEIGEYGTWAVWDNENCLLERLDPKLLHTNFVIIGLNISRPLFSRWSNFRGGRHDKKLELLFNSKPFKDCYMTDLVKCIESDSSKITQKLKKDLDFLEENRIKFQKEMLAVGVDKQTRFILLGSAVHDYFERFINEKFRQNPIYKLGHYSNRFISDEKWIYNSSKTLKKNPKFLE